MAALDDLKVMRKYDKSSMLELIESFPEQCRNAEKIVMGFDVMNAFKSQYKNIVIAGVGGSAIGADLVRSYVSDDAKIPIIVNRNYTLPHFVGKESLLVASSYSGNTEETLSAYRDAKDKNAKIIAITSGGELEKMAKADGFQLLH